MADFLDQAFPEAEGAEPEVVEAPAPAPEPVAEAPEPEPVTPEVHEQTAPEERQPGYVPLAAMMDERDQKKDERNRRIALEAELDQLRQSQQQKQAIPDAYDDPEGYLAFQQQHLQQALQQQKMELSHHWAVEKYGKDGVEEARSWALEKAQKDPGFRAMLEAEMPMQAMPFDWIVQQHKRNGLYSQLPTDVSSLDELIEREIAKRGLNAPAAVAPVAATLQPAPKTAMPPRSIASDSSPISAKEPAAPADFSAIFQR